MERSVQNLVTVLRIFKTTSYLETEEYSESCQASMMQHFFKKPYLTLVYSEPEPYSEPCTAAMM